MATFVHGKGGAVLMSQYDLSQFLNSVSLSSEVDASETTAFGNNDKTYIAGIGDAKVSATGLYDGTAVTGSDVILQAALKAVVNPILTACPAGNIIGKRCYLAAGIETTYEVDEKVTDVVSAKADFQVVDGASGGLILAANKSVATSTTTNETGQDNGVASVNGGAAHLHVTSNANLGTTTLKVQHSVDNVTYTDLATFATVATTVKTGDRVVVTDGTTVNRYLRGASTTTNTGAIVYTIAFARG